MEKVRPGEEFNVAARTWNELIDAKNYFLRHKHKTAAPTGGMPYQIKVKNLTSDLPKGSVLQLGSYLLEDAQLEQSKLWFEGDEPDTDHARVAILDAACPENAIRTAVVFGVAIALVNVNDEDHKFAYVKANQTELESASAGPIAILSAPSTGSQLCAVLLGQSASLRGKLDEELSDGGTATMSVWDWDGSEEADTGLDIEVYDWLGGVEADLKVIATLFGDRYYVTAAECG